jgi:hypothetical protein
MGKALLVISWIISLPLLPIKKLDLDGSSWQTYAKTFIRPLMKDNGTLVLQVTNNEPLGRIILTSL